MPGPRSILHVDMDAFYASVEQSDHPEYRGRPVVVGAAPRQGRGRGVVAACSYEARAHGIHSALPIRDAWRRCPSAVFLAPRMERYQQVSEAVFGIFQRYSDRIEPLSIDEAFLDLTGTRRLHGAPERVAREVKAAIRAELGLVASVGLAPNKFLAKVASDLEKPDGLVVVPPGGEAAFLAGLPVERLWGVGPKTAAVLRGMGVRRIGELASHRAEDLRARFGELGVQLWNLAHGCDPRPVVVDSEPKSLGAETTFAADVRDGRLLQATLLQLAERVAARLRRRGLTAGGATLKYRDERFHTTTCAVRLAQPTDLAEDLYGPLLARLDRLRRGKTDAVRLLGVTATRLGAAGDGADQLGLFPDRGRARRRAAAGAVDLLRERFGSAAVRRAALLDAPEATPADGEE